MIAALLLIVVVASAGCSAPVPITFDGNVVDESAIKAGELLYGQYCATCHGASGQGQFPEAPNMPDATGRYGAPPHNPDGHTWHHDDALLLRYVRDGGMGDPDSFYPMPAFGALLTDQQIISIIGFIKTLWTDEQRTVQRERSEVAADLSQ